MTKSDPTSSPLPSSRVCYCTNVHPGHTTSEILAQLDAHDPRPFMASSNPEYRIGLWLCDTAARELDGNASALEHFAGELNARQIRVITLNGFPQKDFHQPVVKHTVYRPAWTTPERQRHTIRLAQILARLIPEGSRASISTLPVGWRSDEPDLDRAAANLTECAHGFANLADQTGRHITLDLEPEPGCVLDVAEDVLGFYAGPLGRALRAHDPMPRTRILSHLGVCHDTCHSAVMFEDQREALLQYAQAGIHVNKVQVSSAIACKIDNRSIAALAAYAEPRYLHQTMLRTPTGPLFFEDLTEALASDAIHTATECRVHFHTPIYAECIGDHADGLGTTQSEIMPAVRAAQELHPRATIELETYAWPVLPAPHQPESLAEGIAAELDWFERTFPELHA